MKNFFIYNTSSRRKEEFIPESPGEAKIYVCGPTVYNLIHIGNARALTVFDTLRRYLEYIGYKVRYAQNYTDIDDKIIRRAAEEGVSSSEIAERYIAEYRTDADGLSAREADIHPRATESVGDIIALIETLIGKEYAYVAGGDVYFRAKRYDGYGKLSHMPMEALEDGARVEVGEHKEDPMDFALWKAAKPGEPKWASPWGEGRPGWHIECSAMVCRHLGGRVDIHCGGQDLIFPHHENELAQSEAAGYVPFARYWMHNGMLNVDSRKMSKSLGNFFLARESAAEYGYPVLRFYLLSAHYRSPMNYTAEAVGSAKAGYERLLTFLEHLDFLIKNGGEVDVSTVDTSTLDVYKDRFCEAMSDDLNTADAVSVLFDLARHVNTLGFAASRSFAETARAVFLELAGVLGLFCEYGNGGPAESLDGEIESLIERRQEARRARDFKTADEIRTQLASKGIVLEDTPQGVKWRKS